MGFYIKRFRNSIIERKGYAYGLDGFFFFNKNTTDDVPKKTLPNVRERNSTLLIGSPWYPKVYKKFIMDTIKTNIISNFFINQI